MAQTVKNQPAIRETWVRSLAWEDAPEENTATHSSILEWRIPTSTEAWQAPVHGVSRSWTGLSNYGQLPSIGFDTQEVLNIHLSELAVLVQPDFPEDF